LSLLLLMRFITFIVNPLLKFLSMHSMGMFLLGPPLIPPVCQTSRQRQRWKGRGPWREGKGSSSPAHRGKQITPLLWPLPSQGFRCLLAVVNPYKPQTGALIRLPLDHVSSPWTCRLGLCTHFVTRLRIRLALSHTLTQHSTSSPLPEPERYSFTPKTGFLRCLWELIRLPFCLLRQS
jgi:hypothetical protein